MRTPRTTPVPSISHTPSGSVFHRLTESRNQSWSTTLTPAARRGASPAAALTLSGWTAVAGVVAMVALVLAGVVYAVAVKRGFHKGYTRVVKERKPRGLPTTAGSPRR